MNVIKFSSALLCGTALVFLSACKDEETTTAEPVVRPVLSMVVADVESVLQATYPGRAIAFQELNIGFEVPGKLLSRPVDVGSRVEQGEVIAVLDAKPYAAQVRALEGQRAALIATLENAKVELTRRESLLENDFVSQANVDNQIATVRSTEASIDAVEGSLDAARLNLEYTTLFAPFSGQVSQTYVENFQNVNARQPIVRLLDTSRIKMDVAVPENLINLQRFVNSIEVEFASLPGVKLQAEIAHVGYEASTTTRTYPVTIVMDQPEGAQIQPGMAGYATANVRLPEDWAETGIQVPTGAVFSPNTAAPEETFVWVIDPEALTVASKPVEIRSFNERGLLVHGLQQGERVVTAGANTLTEGQKIRLAEGEE